MRRKKRSKKIIKNKNISDTIHALDQLKGTELSLFFERKKNYEKP